MDIEHTLEPVPDTHEPVEVFTALAAKHGLIRPGDKLDQNVLDFAADIVERCASIGDGYNSSTEEANAGEHIRAILGGG